MDVLEQVQTALHRITDGGEERLAADEVISRLGPGSSVIVIRDASPDDPGADVLKAAQLRDAHGQGWVAVCGHYVVVGSEDEPVWSLVNVDDEDGTSST